MYDANVNAFGSFQLMHLVFFQALQVLGTCLEAAPEPRNTIELDKSTIPHYGSGISLFPATGSWRKWRARATWLHYTILHYITLVPNASCQSPFSGLFFFGILNFASSEVVGMRVHAVVVGHLPGY